MGRYCLYLAIGFNSYKVMGFFFLRETPSDLLEQQIVSGLASFGGGISSICKLSNA